MKIKKKTTITLLLLAFFALSYYLVDFSPFSSRGLAQYNGGYGTFDMNSYDAGIVQDVLSNTSEKGFSVARIYYLFDYLFILAIGLLQAWIPMILYPKKGYFSGNASALPECPGFLRNIIANASLPAKITAWFGIARGIFDAVENALLLFIINSYPTEHTTLVQISSCFTTLKLLMIGLWIVGFLAGIVLKRLSPKIKKGSVQGSRSQ